MSDAISRPQPVARYSAIAMTFHWVVAALLLVNVFVGLAAANAPKGQERPLVDMHKSIGLTLLGLILLRILWRLGHTPPPLPSRYASFDRVLSHVVHVGLYAIMLALPLSGYIHDSAFKLADANPLTLFHLVPFPRIGVIKALDPDTKEIVHKIFGAVHVYLGYVLYGLVGLHLLGVAKHHAFDHEAELQRMLPRTYRRPDAAE